MIVFIALLLCTAQTATAMDEHRGVYSHESSEHVEHGRRLWGAAEDAAIAAAFGRRRSDGSGGKSGSNDKYKKCPHGKFRNCKDGSETSCDARCRTCNPGSGKIKKTKPGYRRRYHACQTCKPGKYQGRRGDSSCKTCSNGQYCPRPGCTRCLACPGGKYNGSQKCIPDGQIPFTGGAVGEVFGPNIPSIADVTPMGLTCAPMPGQWIEMAQCFECHPGKYAPPPNQLEAFAFGNQGASKCSRCPWGKYAKGFGNARCENCLFTPDKDVVLSPGQPIEHKNPNQCIRYTAPAGHKAMCKNARNRLVAINSDDCPRGSMVSAVAMDGSVDAFISGSRPGPNRGRPRGGRDTVLCHIGSNSGGLATKCAEINCGTCKTFIGRKSIAPNQKKWLTEGHYPNDRFKITNVGGKTCAQRVTKRGRAHQTTSWGMDLVFDCVGDVETEPEAVQHAIEISSSRRRATFKPRPYVPPACAAHQMETVTLPPFGSGFLHRERCKTYVAPAGYTAGCWDRAGNWVAINTPACEMGAPLKAYCGGGRPQWPASGVIRNVQAPVHGTVPREACTEYIAPDGYVSGCLRAGVIHNPNDCNFGERIGAYPVQPPPELLDPNLKCEDRTPHSVGACSEYLTKKETDTGYVGKSYCFIGRTTSTRRRNFGQDAAANCRKTCGICMCAGGSFQPVTLPAFGSGYLIRQPCKTYQAPAGYTAVCSRTSMGDHGWVSIDSAACQVGFVVKAACVKPGSSTPSHDAVQRVIVPVGGVLRREACKEYIAPNGYTAGCMVGGELKNPNDCAFNAEIRAYPKEQPVERLDPNRVCSDRLGGRTEYSYNGEQHRSIDGCHTYVTMLELDTGHFGVSYCEIARTQTTRRRNFGHDAALNCRRTCKMCDCPNGFPTVTLPIPGTSLVREACKKYVSPPGFLAGCTNAAGTRVAINTASCPVGAKVFSYCSTTVDQMLPARGVVHKEPCKTYLAPKGLTVGCKNRGGTKVPVDTAECHVGSEVYAYCESVEEVVLPMHGNVTMEECKRYVSPLGYLAKCAKGPHVLTPAPTPPPTPAPTPYPTQYPTRQPTRFPTRRPTPPPTPYPTPDPCQDTRHDCHNYATWRETGDPCECIGCGESHAASHRYHKCSPANNGCWAHSHRWHGCYSSYHGVGCDCGRRQTEARWAGYTYCEVARLSTTRRRNFGRDAFDGCKRTCGICRPRGWRRLEELKQAGLSPREALRRLVSLEKEPKESVASPRRLTEASIFVGEKCKDFTGLWKKKNTASGPEYITLVQKHCSGSSGTWLYHASGGNIMRPSGATGSVSADGNTLQWSDGTIYTRDTQRTMTIDTDHCPVGSAVLSHCPQGVSRVPLLAGITVRKQACTHYTASEGYVVVCRDDHGHKVDVGTDACALGARVSAECWDGDDLPVLTLPIYATLRKEACKVYTPPAGYAARCTFKNASTSVTTTLTNLTQCPIDAELQSYCVGGIEDVVLPTDATLNNTACKRYVAPAGHVASCRNAIGQRVAINSDFCPLQGKVLAEAKDADACLCFACGSSTPAVYDNGTCAPPSQSCSADISGAGCYSSVPDASCNCASLRLAAPAIVEHLAASGTGRRLQENARSWVPGIYDAQNNAAFVKVDQQLIPSAATAYCAARGRRLANPTTPEELAALTAAAGRDTVLIGAWDVLANYNDTEARCAAYHGDDAAVDPGNGTTVPCSRGGKFVCGPKDPTVCTCMLCNSTNPGMTFGMAAVDACPAASRSCSANVTEVDVELDVAAKAQRCYSSSPNNVCNCDSYRIVDTSCTDGYFKQNGTCVAWKVCGADEYQVQEPTLTMDRLCMPKTCTCNNGKPASGAACPDHGAQACSVCAPGHVLSAETALCRLRCKSDVTYFVAQANKCEACADNCTDGQYRFGCGQTAKDDDPGQCIPCNAPGQNAHHISRGNHGDAASCAETCNRGFYAVNGTCTATSAPTAAPTSAPTIAPTSAPTIAPTRAPTVAPTLAPTPDPVSVCRGRHCLAPRGNGSMIVLKGTSAAARASIQLDIMSGVLHISASNCVDRTNWCGISKRDSSGDCKADTKTVADVVDKTLQFRHNGHTASVRLHASGKLSFVFPVNASEAQCVDPLARTLGHNPNTFVPGPKVSFKPQAAQWAHNAAYMVYDSSKGISIHTSSHVQVNHGM